MRHRRAGTAGNGSSPGYACSVAYSRPMPSTIREVFASAGLEPEGCVRWNQRVPCRDTGVYAVALTDNRKSLAEALPTAPLRRAGFIELLGVREELRLDGERPSAAAYNAGSPSSGFPTRSCFTSVFQPPAGHACARVLPHASRRRQTARWRLVAEDAKHPEQPVGALRADTQL